MTTKNYNGIDLPIPLIDLKAQYSNYKDEIDAAIQHCLEASKFIGGNLVTEFENAFADYLGDGFFVSCANGTDALEIILSALGIGPGDEVIVPAFTWISTSEVVYNLGAQAIFVDVLPENACIDPQKLERAITQKTKAIICVHLYGQASDLSQLMTICNTNNIHLIEDCAQAHGTTYNGDKVGNFGIASAFSFYPGKNLGAYGDGGGIYTLDEELAEHCRMIAHHGQVKKHQHKIHGRNSRLDAIQAAILRIKLPYLSGWIDRKRAIAGSYCQVLSGINDLQTPIVTNGHSFHIYAIRATERTGLSNYLNEKGIQTSVHYPTALPFQEVYKSRGYNFKDFPIAYHWQNHTLSLPMYAELKNDQIEYITSSIAEFFAS